ncbi:hypothetical protein ACFV7Q_18915 [Streptomyces sp. NPDC059851]|uniref:hypothetical protein n=1 Tax=Streptomyces sp. NPDC059851 TaxID=3346971 RepID=UPI00364FB382
MRTALLKHVGRAAALAALVLATSLGGPAVAAPADHTTLQAQAVPAGLDRRAPKPIDVKITGSGIEAPESAPAGLVSFSVTTDDSNGRFLQAFRPHPGVTVDQVLADLAKAVSRKPIPTAEGMLAVRDEAEMFGGAQVTASVSETFTTPITAGEVVLLDFSAFLQDPAHPITRTLRLHGNQRPGRPTGFPDGFVLARDTPDGPRFDVHGLNRTGDTVLVHNASQELHEVGIQPVAPGTTDAQIQAVFDRTAPGPLPYTGRPVGLGVISPGRSVLLEMRNLPPGTYLIACFAPDGKAGLPDAIRGMHKVVVLT